MRESLSGPLMALALGAATACSATSDLDSRPDTFFLLTLDGAAPPVRVADSAGAPKDLLAELLYLGPNGTFLLESALLPPDADPSTTPSESVERTGTYAILGAEIVLRFACPVDTVSHTVSCPDTWRGTLEGLDLKLREAAGRLREYQRGLEI